MGRGEGKEGRRGEGKGRRGGEKGEGKEKGLKKKIKD